MWPDDPPRSIDSVREVGRVFTAEETRALVTTAETAGVPLSTLVTAAWSVLLHRYADTREVVFGATRTCRRGTVPDADQMLGLLINTVPMRIRVEPDQPVRDWLADVRRQDRTIRPHQFAPLTRIQQWSGVPANTPLFDSLLMYEHRDLQTALSGSVPGWELPGRPGPPAPQPTGHRLRLR